MVLIHNNGDPQRSKRISKAIGEYAHVYMLSTTSESLTEKMLQQREQKERMAT